MNLLASPLAVVGLGYVGLPLAVEFGKHRPVLGFDINQAQVAELRSGLHRTLEVVLLEHVKASQLHFSSQAADLLYMKVPSPHCYGEEDQTICLEPWC